MMNTDVQWQDYEELVKEIYEALGKAQRFRQTLRRARLQRCRWQARFCCYCLGEIETCTVSPEWTA